MTAEQWDLDYINRAYFVGSLVTMLLTEATATRQASQDEHPGGGTRGSYRRAPTPLVSHRLQFAATGPPVRPPAIHPAYSLSLSPPRNFTEALAIFQCGRQTQRPI